MGLNLQTFHALYNDWCKDLFIEMFICLSISGVQCFVLLELLSLLFGLFGSREIS